MIYVILYLVIAAIFAICIAIQDYKKSTAVNLDQFFGNSNGKPYIFVLSIVSLFWPLLIIAVPILLLKNIAVCYVRCSFCSDLSLSLSDFNTHKMISNSVTVAWMINNSVLYSRFSVPRTKPKTQPIIVLTNTTRNIFKYRDMIVWFLIVW